MKRENWESKRISIWLLNHNLLNERIDLISNNLDQAEKIHSKCKTVRIPSAECSLRFAKRIVPLPTELVVSCHNWSILSSTFQATVMALGSLGHVDRKRKREARQVAAWPRGRRDGFSSATEITVAH